MAAPVFVHGKKGTVSINANLFNALTISHQQSAPLEDITYSRSGGAAFADKIPGYTSGSGSITFIYDTANQPTVSPFDLRPGQDSALAMIVYPEGTKPFSFSAYTSSLEFTTGPQAGAVKCSISYETTGTITSPSS